MSSIPPIQWTPEGIILPTDAAILAGAQADQDVAFGGGLNPSLSTPQGQLATSESAIVSDKNSQMAYITNQVDPRYASGRFQDAIGQIYFMTRNPAVSTVVLCTVTGIAGTVLPIGTLALDTSGNTYQSLAAVTIGSNGTATGEWANLQTGPIPAPAGTLTQVYQSIPGWDTITNAAPGTVGNLVESPQEFELRRRNSVAANSHGTPDAIFAAVYAVAGVLNVYVIDNPSGLTVYYGATNYPLAPHSIFISVVGGLSTSIAQAIWQFKDAGCNYNTAPGNGTVETVTVYDANYPAPQPAYPVSFLVPANTPLYVAVQVQNTSALPSGYVALIQAAVLAQFNGQNGNTPAGIASLILASGFYAAVQNAIPGVGVISIFVGLAASPGAYSVQMGIDQMPSLSLSDITVVAV